MHSTEDGGSQITRGGEMDDIITRLQEEVREKEDVVARLRGE